MPPDAREKACRMHLLQLWLSAAILIHVAIGAVLLRDAWRERRHRRSLEARLAALRPGPARVAVDSLRSNPPKTSAV